MAVAAGGRNEMAVTTSGISGFAAAEDSTMEDISKASWLRGETPLMLRHNGHWRGWLDRRRSLNVSIHMGQQMLRDRPRKPDRDRVPQLLILLPSRSCQHESIRESLDGRKLLDRKATQFVWVAMG